MGPPRPGEGGPAEGPGKFRRAPIVWISLSLKVGEEQKGLRGRTCGIKTDLRGEGRQAHHGNVGLQDCHT